MFVRNAYNYDMHAASVLSGLKCEDKSLTLQSQSQDADINVIMKRFAVTGVLPEGGRLPTYQDFEGIFDYRSAMDEINAANRSFAALPAEVRARFGNDVPAFLEFCSHEENLPELRRLGLAKEAVEATFVAPADAPEVHGSGVKSDKKRAKSSDAKSDKDAE